MFTRKSKFSLALMWAMIPLMAFAGLPRVGCVCADGEHMAYCQINRIASVEEQCGCCYGRDAVGGPSAAEYHACAADGMSCCGASRSTGSDRSPALKTDCPCRSVVDQSIVIAVAKVVLDLDQVNHTPLALPAAVQFALHSRVSLDQARGDMPPPPDLITTLGVLLI